MLAIVEEGFGDRNNRATGSRDKGCPGIVHPAVGNGCQTVTHSGMNYEAGTADHRMANKNLPRRASGQSCLLTRSERNALPESVTQRTSIYIDQTGVTENGGRVTVFLTRG